jgi:stage II sporulation protein M
MNKHFYRKNMKKQFSKHIQENFSLYTFTTVLLVMGVIFGAITVNSLSVVQKEDLFDYLNRFFGQVAQNEVAGQQAMFNQSFTHYIKYIGLMWVLGLSIIGLPVILILIFLKGIVVGFTVGFLVNQMEWNGFFLSFVSVLPQNIILIPAFVVIGTAAISFSLKMIKGQFVKRVNEPIFPQFLRYTLLMLLIGLSIGVASVFEAFVSPVLMKAVIGS